MTNFLVLSSSTGSNNLKSKSSLVLDEYETFLSFGGRGLIVSSGGVTGLKLLTSSPVFALWNSGNAGKILPELKELV